MTVRPNSVRIKIVRCPKLASPKFQAPNWKLRAIANVPRSAPSIALPNGTICRTITRAM